MPVVRALLMAMEGTFGKAENWWDNLEKVH
jgi:hypothetical protein